MFNSLGATRNMFPIESENPLVFSNARAHLLIRNFILIRFVLLLKYNQFQYKIFPTIIFDESSGSFFFFSCFIF
jgi:hypothetical protein